MHIRLTVYQDIFVNVTLTLDEATALLDVAETAHESTAPEVAAVAEKLRAGLESALGRALEIQRKKES